MKRLSLYAAKQRHSLCFQKKANKGGNNLCCDSWVISKNAVALERGWLQKKAFALVRSAGPTTMTSSLAASAVTKRSRESRGCKKRVAKNSRLHRRWRWPWKEEERESSVNFFSVSFSILVVVECSRIWRSLFIEIFCYWWKKLPLLKAKAFVKPFFNDSKHTKKIVFGTLINEN